MKKENKTSRRIPENWHELHSEECDGKCVEWNEEGLLSEDNDAHENCPVRHYTDYGEWSGPRPPMHIVWDSGIGTFFDRYGQHCEIQLGEDTLSMGVRWALTGPDEQPPWSNEMWKNWDMMSFDHAGARNILADLRHFVKEGSVPPQKRTNRGFGLGTFQDSLGQECSLQDSSLGTEAACWFGVDTNLGGRKISMRMHLTTDMVVALIPWLVIFIT